MNIQEIGESLNTIERKVLAQLSNSEQPVIQIVENTQLLEVEVMRGLQWLSNKNLVFIREEVHEIVDLDSNGLNIINQGLPERRLLNYLNSAGGNATMQKIDENSSLSKEEIGASIGALKKHAAVNILKKEEITVELTDIGIILLDKELLEEKFLRNEFPAKISKLKDEEKHAMLELLKRKNILKTYTKKERLSTITDLGHEVLNVSVDAHIEKLDEEIIKTKQWKNQKFRRYDVTAKVSAITGGKKQHYRKFLDECRSKFMSLGFEEMTGPMVESEFWNMDSLFMPQFHSARDIHDAYYIKDPKYTTDLPINLVQKVKEAHENGFGTGSQGWRYKFDIQRTHRQLLRSQTTACSARKLISKDLKIPGKYFAIQRNFRYDVIDATHNCDFNQTEGFIIGEKLNIQHLFGLLRMFAKEFAETDEIKVVPCYYPFTEPSASLYAKHPQLGWMELGGSGIFRPEMLKPLGISQPVIAWGLGIDRIAMFKLGINDIRELFSHDLDLLRNTKVT